MVAKKKRWNVPDKENRRFRVICGFFMSEAKLACLTGGCGTWYVEQVIGTFNLVVKHRWLGREFDL
ncbi:MAG: hypothetical protein MI742_16355 [Desulfobacterales bacterium]|nr:hypothetical protein [Desulfobacterales bacterium]